MSYTMKADDVFGLASAIHADVRQKGDELFFKYCPYCDGGTSHDKETFSINLESGAFKCFRSGCGKQGHFVELAREHDYPLEYDEEPTQYKSLPQVKLPVREPALKYLMSRGISAEVGERYEVTTPESSDNLLMFLFRDENGVLMFIKYRKIDFDKSRDKNKEWCEKDTQPILFGMDKCRSFNQLIVTEGQLDSLSVATAGFNNAVSVPNGANGFTWVQKCRDWVCKFKEIVIFGDREKDHITLVDGFEKNFPEKKLRVVRAADYLGEKDANAILQKYGAEAIINCIKNAEEIMSRNVKRLSDVKAVDLESQEHVKTGIYCIDRVINGLYMGTVTLLTGRRGEGKSTLASQIVANVLDQTDPNGKPYSVFIYSGELPDFHFKRWIDLQIAGDSNIDTTENEYGNKNYTLKKDTVDVINAWYADRAYLYDNAAVANLDEENETLIETITNAVQRYNIKMILLDNLMTALEYDPKADIYREQSKFVGALKNIAMKYEVAILLIAHPRKESAGGNNARLTNDSISGSADITNRVDVVMNYVKDTAENTSPGGKIAITKNRLTGRTAQDLQVLYGKKSKRIICNDNERQKVFGCFAVSNEEDDGGIPF